MQTSDFYANLAVHADFSVATRPQSFAPLPDDWHVVMSDVRDSTRAVAEGNYKSVNLLGASTITAVLNAAGQLDVPYVFEGDGAMLCVPPQLLEPARRALLYTRRLAAEEFGLDLRVATLPVSAIRAAGYDIRVARYHVSENYIQAVFTGGGLGYADRCMKDPATAASCAVPEEGLEPQGSFEGLECRWQDIPSRHQEIVSVMVLALAEEPQAAAALYRDVIAEARRIYGADEDSHPISPPNLNLTLDADRLAGEVHVRAMGGGRLGQWLYLAKLRFIVLIGKAVMRYGLRLAGVDWGQYKASVVRNSDVRKFKDLYRQIFSGGAAQREELVGWLERRAARGELAYGVHVTDRALMTCVVFDHANRHTHFVDGADGGLFLAAKDLKERLRVAAA